MEPVLLTATDARFPTRLRERLGAGALAQLSVLGNLDLLAQPKVALFCSARCPGSAILAAYAQAAHWRTPVGASSAGSIRRWRRNACAFSCAARNP
jgi:hypothetical protein